MPYYRVDLAFVLPLLARSEVHIIYILVSIKLTKLFNENFLLNNVIKIEEKSKNFSLFFILSLFQDCLLFFTTTIYYAL